MEDHLDPDKEVRPYFSEITCDCGCDNKMPQHLVDHGWKFLRGHKPKGAGMITPKKTLHTGRAPRVKPGLVMDMPHVHAFVRTSILQLIGQHVEAVDEIRSLKRQQIELLKKLLPLKTEAQRLYSGLELLYPAIANDGELKKALNCLKDNGDTL